MMNRLTWPSIKIFFADFVSPEDHCQKELLKSQCPGTPVDGTGAATTGTSGTLVAETAKQWWCDILIEQVINASIIAGIAALATNFDSWSVALKAFGITFLIEMRKYRKL
ncbi:MAG: hypothetical protein NTU41_09730 [Chloroflexi bacterium]|nr:hypothetical protein [Chloroflexota bacterium]